MKIPQEILIIRHAHSLANGNLTKSLDSSVSQRGCHQIKALVEWLKSGEFDLTGYEGLTSPYLRCLQTACAINKATGIPFTVHGGLREYHINKEEDDLAKGGMRLPNRSDDYAECTTWPKSHWRGKSVFYKNEELDDFIERIKLFLNSLKAGGKYIFVSHGCPSRALHHVACGIDLEKIKTRYSQEVDPRDGIRNASLTWIKGGSEIWFSKVVYDDEAISRLDEMPRSCGTAATNPQSENPDPLAGVSGGGQEYQDEGTAC